MCRGSSSGRPLIRDRLQKFQRDIFLRGALVFCVANCKTLWKSTLFWWKVGRRVMGERKDMVKVIFWSLVIFCHLHRTPNYAWRLAIGTLLCRQNRVFLKRLIRINFSTWVCTHFISQNSCFSSLMTNLRNFP